MLHNFCFCPFSAMSSNIYLLWGITVNLHFRRPYLTSLAIVLIPIVKSYLKRNDITLLSCVWRLLLWTVKNKKIFEDIYQIWAWKACSFAMERNFWITFSRRNITLIVCLLSPLLKRAGFAFAQLLTWIYNFPKPLKGPFWLGPNTGNTPIFL